MKKLGFFGGCFNPPTVAHIELIEKAIKENNLDMVYFVPMEIGRASCREREPYFGKS